MIFAKIDNPQPKGPKRLDQGSARSLIRRQQAVATSVVGSDILTLRLVTANVKAREFESRRGYDQNASRVKITHKEAKRVPFAGNVRKLGLDR